ncbi:hypothetical protein H4R34_006245, partial [Dimargaris verticillata]
WQPQTVQGYACLLSAAQPNEATRLLSTSASGGATALGPNGLLQPSSSVSLRWASTTAHASLAELARAVDQRQPKAAWLVFADLRAHGATGLINEALWRQLVGLLAFPPRISLQRESGLAVENQLMHLSRTMAKAAPIQEPETRQRLRQLCLTWLTGPMVPLTAPSHSTTRSSTPAALDIFAAAS